MFVLRRLSYPLSAVAFSPDGRSLAAVGKMGEVLVWDLQTKIDPYPMHPTGDSKRRVFFAGNDVLMWLGKALWRIPLADPQRVESLPPGVIVGASAAAVSAEGRRICVASLGKVSSYALPDFTPLWAVDWPSQLVTCVSYAANGSRLAFGSVVGQVSVRNATTGEQVNTLRSERMIGITAISLSPDGRTVAWCERTHLHAQRVDLQESIGHVTLGRTHFLAVAFHPSGAFFATANGDGTVDYWDAATGTRRGSFDWKVGKLTDVTFDATGDRAACSSATGHVVVWDVDR